MAARFDAGADLLYINPATGADDDNLIACGWYRHEAAPPATCRLIWWATTAGGGYRLDVTAAGDIHVASALGSDVVKAALTVGNWYWWALVRGAGTNARGIVYDPSDRSISTAEAPAPAFTHGIISLGGDGTNGIRGCLAHVKVWSGVAGTLNELEARALGERFVARPAHPTGLWGWWPIFAGAAERVRDYSGHGRPLAAAGTLTDAKGPAVCWGAPILQVRRAATAAVTAEAAGALSGLTVASAVAAEVMAAGSAQLSGLAVTGAAAVEVVSDVAAALAGLTAQGAAAAAILGNGAPRLAALEAQVAAVVAISAEAGAWLPALLVSADAGGPTAAAEVAGRLPGLVVLADAAAQLSALAAAQLPGLRGQAVAELPIGVSAAVLLPALRIEAAGVLPIAGAAAGLLPAIGVIAGGSVLLLGSASIALPGLVVVARAGETSPLAFVTLALRLYPALSARMNLRPALDAELQTRPSMDAALNLREVL